MSRELPSARLSHPPMASFAFVQEKLLGMRLDQQKMYAIIQDIAQGRYTDIHKTAFLCSCTSHSLNDQELIDLTQAMTDVGEKLHWNTKPIVDKHFQHHPINYTNTHLHKH